MHKCWLAPSIALLVSLSLLGESSNAYTQQVDQVNPEASHLDTNLVARNQISNILRRVRNVPALNIRITPNKLRHSFDGHAIEWFGRKVPATAENLRLWQGFIERTARSNLRLRDFRDGHETIAYLARVNNNRWFVAHFFANGPKAGELATAFFPNQKQVRRMLELLQWKP